MEYKPRPCIQCTGIAAVAMANSRYSLQHVALAACAGRMLNKRGRTNGKFAKDAKRRGQRNNTFGSDAVAVGSSLDFDRVSTQVATERERGKTVALRDDDYNGQANRWG